MLTVWCVPTIRFLGYAFEGLAIILDAHEVACAFIALLKMSVRPLELGAPTDCALAIAFAGIRSHVILTD